MEEDANKKLEETQDDSSIIEEPKEDKREERTVPLTALQEERKKRQELEQRLNALETSFSTKSDPSDTDPKIETFVAELDPYLRRKGFITREEKEAEDNSRAYAEEMKRLSKDIDGSDGRPPFDPYEVAEFGKQHRIYDLETAYEKLHKKELIDWHLKNATKGEDSEENEKPSEPKSRVANPSLTREYIAQKIKSPGGHEWYEKNRERILNALHGGEIK